MINELWPEQINICFIILGTSSIKLNNNIINPNKLYLTSSQLFNIMKVTKT